MSAPESNCALLIFIYDSSRMMQPWFIYGCGIQLTFSMCVVPCIFPHWNLIWFLGEFYGNVSHTLALFQLNLTDSWDSTRKKSLYILRSTLSSRNCQSAPFFDATLANFLLLCKQCYNCHGVQNVTDLLLCCMNFVSAVRWYSTLPCVVYNTSFMVVAFSNSITSTPCNVYIQFYFFHQ